MDFSVNLKWFSFMLHFILSGVISLTISGRRMLVHYFPNASNKFTIVASNKALIQEKMPQRKNIQTMHIKVAVRCH